MLQGHLAGLKRDLQSGETAGELVTSRSSSGVLAAPFLYFVPDLLLFWESLLAELGAGEDLEATPEVGGVCVLEFLRPTAPFFTFFAVLSSPSAPVAGIVNRNYQQYTSTAKSHKKLQQQGKRKLCSCKTTETYYSPLGVLKHTIPELKLFVI